MKLNELDFDIIYKQKNVRDFTINILMRGAFGNNKDLFSYIRNKKLYEKIGIPEIELELYDINLSKRSLMYYFDDPNNPLAKKLYDMYIEIYSNSKNAASVFLSINNFIDIGREGNIPKELIDHYLEFGYSQFRYLVTNFVTQYSIVPPDYFLSILLKDKKQTESFYDRLDSMDRIATNKNLKNAISKTFERMRELKKKEMENDNRVNQESFKSFFYKNIH
jgi:hypothetical protein